MPVIRGQIKRVPLTSNQRKALLKDLSNELAGQTTPNGPVIYQIPLELSDRWDILVVWDAFQDLRSEDRTALILEAYKKGQTAKIAQALGVTWEEALEQSLLMYKVDSPSRSDKVKTSELRKAMLDEGGYERADGRVILRFPTWEMAEEASIRLMEQMPQVQWRVEQLPTYG